jgi:hypothetical protein
MSNRKLNYFRQNVSLPLCMLLSCFTNKCLDGQGRWPSNLRVAIGPGGQQAAQTRANLGQARAKYLGRILTLARPAWPKTWVGSCRATYWAPKGPALPRGPGSHPPASGVRSQALRSQALRPSGTISPATADHTQHRPHTAWTHIVQPFVQLSSSLDIIDHPCKPGQTKTTIRSQSPATPVPMRTSLVPMRTSKR